jgi:putative oxidoreductase
VTSPASSFKSSALDYAAVLARWLLGGVFIYMGYHKALHPEDFLKLVHDYRMVSTPFLLNSIGAALPWFEVFCGLLLVAGVAVRGSALMLALMLVPFTGIVIRRALAIAAAQGLSFWVVKFDCGCGNGEVIIWQKVIENTLLFLLSCWLLAGRGRRLALRFSLFPGPDAPNPHPTPAAG